MGRRGAVASTAAEAARLDDRELEGQLLDARIRLGLAGSSGVRSGWRKRIVMLEREVARRRGDG